MTKKEIYDVLDASVNECHVKRSSLTKTASVTDYSHLAYTKENGEKIWTKAFKEAIADNEVVLIPFSCEPYFIDETIIVPSNRVIKAENGAHIKRAEGFTYLMLRNEHNADGSFAPEPETDRDSNITIIGGLWDGGCNGYAKNLYGEGILFHGVTASMFLNHADFVTVKDVTVANSGEFAIQVGDVTNIHFENISFINCHADGIHIGGNSRIVSTKNISGNVGDDLVALNAFDWEHSSVNFGEIRCVLCEKLELDPDARYKALRILPGLYTYQDGSVSDCKITDVIIKDVKGINTYKMYFQREAHNVDDALTYGAPGKADNIYFEDIEANLDAPIDAFDTYLASDPVCGHFSVFELGSDIGKLSFENIRVTIDKEKHPMSYFMQIGAKTVRIGDREIFDPTLGGNVKKITLSGIYINGKALTEADFDKYICEINFDDIYGDGKSSSSGKIEKIKLK